MTPRRCFDCGARAADGADVRECASCAFDYCNDHAATVGGVTKCEECKEADVSEPVPQSAWRWHGVAAHFICGQYCRFHMATEVGPWLISTIGEFFPANDGPMQTLGAAADSFYETFVFRIGDTPKRCDEVGCDCGLPTPESWSEVDGERWATRKQATDGHMAQCVVRASIRNEESADA